MDPFTAPDEVSSAADSNVSQSDLTAPALAQFEWTCLQSCHNNVAGMVFCFKCNRLPPTEDESKLKLNQELLEKMHQQMKDELKIQVTVLSGYRGVNTPRHKKHGDFKRIIRKTGQMLDQFGAYRYKLPVGSPYYIPKTDLDQATTHEMDGDLFARFQDDAAFRHQMAGHGYQEASEMIHVYNIARTQHVRPESIAKRQRQYAGYAVSKTDQTGGAKGSILISLREALKAKEASSTKERRKCPNPRCKAELIVYRSSQREYACPHCGKGVEIGEPNGKCPRCHLRCCKLCLNRSGELTARIDAPLADMEQGIRDRQRGEQLRARFLASRRHLGTRPSPPLLTGRPYQPSAPGCIPLLTSSSAADSNVLQASDSDDDMAPLPAGPPPDHVRDLPENQPSAAPARWSRVDRLSQEGRNIPSNSGGPIFGPSAAQAKAEARAAPARKRVQRKAPAAKRARIVTTSAVIQEENAEVGTPSNPSSAAQPEGPQSEGDRVREERFRSPDSSDDDK